jgi:predicted dehydrogenase
MNEQKQDALRVGVVGVGAIGKNHARCLAEIDGCELAAIYDRDMDLAQRLAADYNTVAATSLEEFIELVDAATVAAPTSLHLELGSALLRAGRHVLVEKPITNTIEDARTLVNLANEHQRILQVGHIERFNPVLAQLEHRISEPRFIEVHRLSPFPNRSLDIGVVLDVMIHDIEIILHLVKSELISIDAVGVPVMTKREDIANARLRFADGCVVNLTASRISPEKMRKIRVFQSDAYLSLDYQEQSGEIYRKGLLGIKKEEVKVEKEEPLKMELASFCKCAAEGYTPKVSGHEAAAALQVAIQITGLIETGEGRVELKS